MKNLPEYFGSLVFDDTVMKSRLPKETYDALRKTRDEGKHIGLNIANVVANAMKDWAVEKGATHFTHWFQPMTGVTAEKHDSFISPTSDGKVIMEFSGSELVKGESDASSFPSGGLRTTFEARGYTAWDPTSYAFIRDKTLCIPTAFCSYGGEALDKKTPLLRSMEALNRQVLRILRLFGNTDVTYTHPVVGAEQEYFLIDKAMFDRRKDLIYTGKTLFGAKPPKGQELSDHYYGAIQPRIAEYMDDLNEELWKLGIFAKTQHNEVAPAQHELAPVFTTANIAADHNQLTMEIMQQVAKKHDLVCLLHEKPFDGVNGSGKHNNWSIMTNTGVNLLSPGETPSENARFLLFMCAIIQAVDDYQDLLRISVTSASNDCRLGGNEAPPAIISVFIGDELASVFDAVENDKKYSLSGKTRMRLGVSSLPKFFKDTTDRNRTSPFAFTGNKFEFRMLGSSDSIACANIMINTSVAESLRQYADILENADDFEIALNSLIKDTIKNHKRIIFNQNGYDEEWVNEATQKRKLLNLRTTPECMKHFLSEKNLALFKKHRIYTEAEAYSRYEIILENYCKIVNIEAGTMVQMARCEILPAILAYTKQLSDTVISKKAACPNIDCSCEQDIIVKLSYLSSSISDAVASLENSVSEAKSVEDIGERSSFFGKDVLEKMRSLRGYVDISETLVAENMWPLPTYGDLLFGVR